MSYLANTHKILQGFERWLVKIIRSSQPSENLCQCDTLIWLNWWHIRLSYCNCKERSSHVNPTEICLTALKRLVLRHQKLKYTEYQYIKINRRLATVNDTVNYSLNLPLLPFPLIPTAIDLCCGEWCSNSGHSAGWLLSKLGPWGSSRGALEKWAMAEFNFYFKQKLLWWGKCMWYCSTVAFGGAPGYSLTFRKCLWRCNIFFQMTAVIQSLWCPRRSISGTVG